MTPRPLVGDYHIDIGIPEAARIKALEEKMVHKMITGGKAALVGMFPHLGGLIVDTIDRKTKLHGISMCGSSLISATRAVTAAHCWSSPLTLGNYFDVVFASNTLFSGGTRFKTSDVVTHPKYDPIRLGYHDIAVIKFKPVKFTKDIQPIALAKGNNLFVGAWATAAGYGRLTDGPTSPLLPPLHYANMEVISNSACRKSFYPDIVHDFTLCVATKGGISTCSGDSGGPLETNVTKVRTLIGIVSFGKEHCEQSQPAGFIRVSFFRSWVLSI